MRILQIIPYFGMGGAEIMCENLIYSLLDLGHEVSAISLYSINTPITERLEAKGIKILYLNKKGGFDPSVVMSLAKQIKKFKPDIIHTHTYTTKYAIPAAIMSGVKGRVHTVHSVAEKECMKSDQIINRVFFRYCRLIPVALSRTVSTTIHQTYGLPMSKIPVIFNGIDLSRCRPKDTYVANDVFTIVHVGSFSEPKNHGLLLRAFQLFHNKYPNTKLQLIGDGPKRAEIEALINEQQLEDAVELLGQQASVFEYLHSADVFTLPSIYEGIPMSMIEAMGTGLAIVATPVGGIPEMVNNNCAILVPGVSEAVAEAFERYYLSDELREEHGKAAKEASIKFSSQAMAKQYLAVYAEMI